MVPPNAINGVAAATLATWPLRRSSETLSPQTRWAKLPEMVRNDDDLLELIATPFVEGDSPKGRVE
jgi:hypothetical protein